MSGKIHSHRRYWIGVVIWLTLIYSTLYIMRPVCVFLKANTPFTVLVNTLMVVILGAVAIRLFFRKVSYRPLPVCLLIAVIAAYLAGLLVIRNPEEKIHFIEYGILAYLIFKALEADVRPVSAYGLSFLLTALFGWIDEGIQHLLPNRYYQVEDVFLNAVSGLLALLLVFIGRSAVGSGMNK